MLFLVVCSKKVYLADTTSIDTYLPVLHKDKMTAQLLIDISLVDSADLMFYIDNELIIFSKSYGLPSFRYSINEAAFTRTNLRLVQDSCASHKNIIYYNFNNRLISLCTVDGVLSELVDDELISICKINITDNVLNDYNFNTSNALVIDGNFIYLLIEKSNAQQGCSLFQYDISTKSFNLIEKNGMAHIAPFLPGQLLVYYDGMIRNYDPALKKYGDIVIPADTPPSPYIYDSRRDILYYMFNGNIFSTNFVSAPIMVRAVTEQELFRFEDYPEKRKSRVSSLIPLDNGQLVHCDSDDKLIYVSNPIEDDVDVNELRIATTSQIENSRNIPRYMYQLLNPHVQIIEHAKYNEYDYYTELLMTGEPCDIYTADTSSGFYKLLRKGYVKQPFHTEKIDAMYDTFLPEVQAAIGLDGKLLAVPISMDLFIWDYDQVRWNEIGLPNPPETLHELYELMDLWQTRYQDKYINTTLIGTDGFGGLRTNLFDNLIRLYAYERATGEQPVNFDTRIFRNMLRKVNSLTEDTINFPPLLCATDHSYPLQHTLVDIDNSPYEPLIPPLIDNCNDKSVTAHMTLSFIGADAPNPDLATDYLEYLLTHIELYQVDLPYMLNPCVEFANVLTYKSITFYEKVCINNIKFQTDMFSSEGSYSNGSDLYIFKFFNIQNFMEDSEYDELRDVYPRESDFDNLINMINTISYKSFY
jgi:hypothetical protein